MTLHFESTADLATLSGLVDSGLTVAEIAERLDVPYRVAHYNMRLLQGASVQIVGEAKDDGEQVPCFIFTPEDKRKRGRPGGIVNLPRAQRMASMYRQGLTLEKIGQTFGMTRERVRQLLAKQGVTAQEGGRSKQAKSKATNKLAAQDARYLARHGVTFDAYKQARDSGLIRSYTSQCNGAKNRGIEWGLNFAQWLDVWTSSGKLDQRGRGKGKYVMSRIKDEGGYVMGNVHIQLATENSLEAVSKWRGKTKSNPGVFLLYPGMAHPYLAKVGRVRLGFFASEEEAIAARQEYIAANGLTLKCNGAIKSRGKTR